MPALASLLLAATAASAAPCTRAHDLELEAAIPLSILAKLASLPGPRAKAAAGLLERLGPETPLKIGVTPRQAAKQPGLPLMGDRAMMQHMRGRPLLLAHDILHEEGRGEKQLASDPKSLAAFTEALLPVYVHELSHAGRAERPVRWPVSATIENELIASYAQALFAAESVLEDPGFAGLHEVYRLQRAAEKGGKAAWEAYRRKATGKRVTVEGLEAAAASTALFERVYRRAYDKVSSLRDPLTAGLRITDNRAELAHLLGSIRDIPEAQRGSAQALLDHGKSDDTFWLDGKATADALKDADAELAELRKELDAKRPAIRAWFEASAGGPVDWNRFEKEAAGKIVGVASPEPRR